MANTVSLTKRQRDNLAFNIAYCMEQTDTPLDDVAKAGGWSEEKLEILLAPAQHPKRYRSPKEHRLAGAARLFGITKPADLFLLDRMEFEVEHPEISLDLSALDDPPQPAATTKPKKPKRSSAAKSEVVTPPRRATDESEFPREDLRSLLENRLVTLSAFRAVVDHLDDQTL